MHVGRTNVTNANEITLWSGEDESGEIESKGGFDEHHGARSRSKRSRRGCGEECGKTTLGREGRKECVFYTLDTRRSFQGQKGDQKMSRYNELRCAFQGTSGAPLICQSGILVIHDRQFTLAFAS
jgi:hypothetical protein